MRILQKIYLDTIAPSTLSGAGGASSFHRNNRPDGGQVIGEGLGHLDVGSLWTAVKHVGGAAVGIMIGGWPLSHCGNGKLQHENKADRGWLIEVFTKIDTGIDVKNEDARLQSMLIGLLFFLYV